MKCGKVVKKIIMQLQNSKEIKRTDKFDYSICIEFNPGTIDKIIVATHVINRGDVDRVLVVFSIPKSFNFSFVNEMNIPKKVFKDLVYYYITRYTLSSLLNSYVIHKDVDYDKVEKKILKSVDRCENDINQLFFKYSEILDRDEFDNMFA